MSVTDASDLDTVLVNVLKTMEVTVEVVGGVAVLVPAPVIVVAGAAPAPVAVAVVTAPVQDPAHPSAGVHLAPAHETTHDPSLALLAGTGTTAPSPATSLLRGGTAPRAATRVLTGTDPRAETGPGLVPEEKLLKGNLVPGAVLNPKEGLDDPEARVSQKADLAVGVHQTADLAVDKLTHQSHLVPGG